jgi:hypothetical protein
VTDCSGVETGACANEPSWCCARPCRRCEGFPAFTCQPAVVRRPQPADTCRTGLLPCRRRWVEPSQPFPVIYPRHTSRPAVRLSASSLTHLASTASLRLATGCPLRPRCLRITRHSSPADCHRPANVPPPPLRCVALVKSGSSSARTADRLDEHPRHAAEHAIGQSHDMLSDASPDAVSSATIISSAQSCPLLHHRLDGVDTEMSPAVSPTVVGRARVVQSYL